MKIAIGTLSKLKIRAAEAAIAKLKLDAVLVAVKTDSGISNQPIGLEEILKGAKSRATGALQKEKADFAIGVESGIINIKELNRWAEIPVVVTVSSNGKLSFSLGAAHPLPDWIIAEVKDNDSEMGVEVQKLDSTMEKDPTRYFSKDLVRREELISQAILCAMIELINEDKFSRSEKL